MPSSSIPPPGLEEQAPSREQNPPRRIQLSEEEKAVLVQCRRNSIARGLPLGVGALLTLRWFIHQGRVPGHVTRWTGLYYTGAFLGAFYVGVASYKQTCMDQIMALDNSMLKDQLKKNVAKLRGFDGFDNEEGQSPPPKPHPPPQRPRSTRYTPPPDVAQRESPSLNSGYEKDKRMLDRQEEIPNQPDAFGSVDHVTQTTPTNHQEHSSKTRGRNYDDIRESSRKRDEVDRGGRKRGEEEQDWRQEQSRRVVRKNKYGDDIEK